MVPTNMSAPSVQNIHDSSSKRPGSIVEVSDCTSTQETDEKDVEDDDWDAFQSLPATVSNDDGDSARTVSPISEEIPPESSHHEYNPQENASLDISDMNIAASAMEDTAYAGKDLEKPFDLQGSSTEQGKHELSGLSGEDCDELNRTVGCTEPSAHIKTPEKPQVHDSGVISIMNDSMDLANEANNEPVGESKGISGEFQSIEGDVLDENIASKVDSTSNSNNLLDIMEDVGNNVLRVSDKLGKDDSKDCGENLSCSSNDVMSGNVLSRCEGTENAANLETKPEPFVDV
jgi:hypothetical protein